MLLFLRMTATKAITASAFFPSHYRSTVLRRLAFKDLYLEEMTLKPANARAKAGIGLDACALLGLEQFNGSEDAVKDSGMLLEFILGRHHDCKHEVALKIQGEQ